MALRIMYKTNSKKKNKKSMENRDFHGLQKSVVDAGEADAETFLAFRVYALE